MTGMEKTTARIRNALRLLREKYRRKKPHICVLYKRCISRKNWSSAWMRCGFDFRAAWKLVLSGNEDRRTQCICCRSQPFAPER